MANEFMVVLLMIVLFFSGGLIAFNLIHIGGFGLDLSFQGGFVSMAGVFIARLVGLILMVLSVWVSVNIIRG